MSTPLPTKRPAPARWPRRLSVVAVATALVGGTVAVRTWPVAAVTDHWTAQLDELPDDQVAPFLAQVIELFPSGVDCVVQALGSSRPAVRAAAGRRLAAEIDSWRRHSPTYPIRARRLAESLARGAETLNDDGRTAVWRLADAIVERVRRDRFDDAGAVLVACGRALAATEPAGIGPDRAGTQAALRDARTAADEIAQAGAGTAEPSADDAAATLLVPPLAGGGLPITIADGPRPAHGASRDAPPDATPHPEPAALVAPSAQPLVQRGQASPIPTEVPPTKPDGRSVENPQTAAPRRALVLTAAQREIAGTNGLVDLLTALHGDADQRVAAEAELASRGYSPRQIEIGRHLTDPDPDQRRAWAELLPRLGDVEARPWLLWLSHDADASVRGAVLSLLATSGDPQLLRRVRQAATEDADERVRATAARFIDAAASDRRP